MASASAKSTRIIALKPQIYFLTASNVVRAVLRRWKLLLLLLFLWVLDTFKMKARIDKNWQDFSMTKSDVFWQDFSMMKFYKYWQDFNMVKFDNVWQDFSMVKFDTIWQDFTMVKFNVFWQDSSMVKFDVVKALKALKAKITQTHWPMQLCFAISF